MVSSTSRSVLDGFSAPLAAQRAPSPWLSGALWGQRGRARSGAGMREAGAGCGDGRAQAEPCLGPGGRLAAAVCLGAVGSLGFCSNLLVLLLFWRFPALRSPINLLLLNMALSDLLGCALGTPLGLLRGENGVAWAAPGMGWDGMGWDGMGWDGMGWDGMGWDGMGWDGMGQLWFGTGIISLISLAVLSYERCCTMTRTAEPDTTNYRKAWAAIILSWTYSLLWTVPPLLGWSSYGPEGAVWKWYRIFILY
uniref:G-protein coupled receptors family 1 profile domain-containing protein n=1 Tax=Junco hyemalis TaxID=40217 RepID=A0A8C5I8Q2_JUNHY